MSANNIDQTNNTKKRPPMEIIADDFAKATMESFKELISKFPYKMTEIIALVNNFNQQIEDFKKSNPINDTQFHSHLEHKKEITECYHGERCRKYKCQFSHPPGRVIKDCPHGMQCSEFINNEEHRKVFNHPKPLFKKLPQRSYNSPPPTPNPITN